MSTTTTNLGLFKYDVNTDGQLAFNITQALNNNWDIIDANYSSGSIATYENPGIVQPDGSSIFINENGILSMGNHGYLLSTYHSGTTWYRTYSDGFKMCGGQVSTTATDIDWSQPTIGSDGTLGGTSFACTASTTYSTSYQAWKAFDNNDTTCWQAKSGTTTGYITFYNPTAIKISSMTIRNKNVSGGSMPKTGNIYGSNNGSSWTNLTSWNNSNYTVGSAWSIAVNSGTYYKYYKFDITASNVQHTVAVASITISATYQGGSGTNIVFPISFSNTNYSFNLGFSGGSGTSTYVSTKSAAGMTLSSTPSGTCSYVCMGW